MAKLFRWIFYVGLQESHKQTYSLDPGVSSNFGYLLAKGWPVLGLTGRWLALGLSLSEAAADPGRRWGKCADER